MYSRVKRCANMLRWILTGKSFAPSAKKIKKIQCAETLNSSHVTTQVCKLRTVIFKFPTAVLDPMSDE